MSKNSKKVWANYIKTRAIFFTYISLFIIVPILLILFSMMPYAARLKEIGAWEAIKISFTHGVVDGIRRTCVVLPVLFVVAIVRLLLNSAIVEFTEDSILYHKNILCKRAKTIIPYSDITKCLVTGRLWYRRNKLQPHGKTIIYRKSDIIAVYGNYYKLVEMLVQELGEDKIEVVTEKGNFKSLSQYFNVDFSELPPEKQSKLLKSYCSPKSVTYKSGQDILRKN